jgi:short-subunit dehydrogenase
MTTSFRKGALWASPEQIGDGIYRAIHRKNDVVYLPWFWRWIMLVIRMIPESIFKRSKL